MGKIGLILLGTMAFFSVESKAAYYNIDLKTAGQVTANTVRV